MISRRGRFPRPISSPGSLVGPNLITRLFCGLALTITSFRANVGMKGLNISFFSPCSLTSSSCLGLGQMPAFTMALLTMKMWTVNLMQKPSMESLAFSSLLTISVPFYFVKFWDRLGWSCENELSGRPLLAGFVISQTQQKKSILKLLKNDTGQTCSPCSQTLPGACSSPD